MCEEIVLLLFLRYLCRTEDYENASIIIHLLFLFQLKSSTITSSQPPQTTADNPATLCHQLTCDKQSRDALDILL